MARQIIVSTIRRQGTIRLGDSLGKFRDVGSAFASDVLAFAARGAARLKYGYVFLISRLARR